MDNATEHQRSQDSSPQEGNVDCFFDAREYESSGSEEESPPRRSTVKTRLNYCEKDGVKSGKQREGASGYEDELGGKTCRTVIGYNQGKSEGCDSSVSTIKSGSDVEALADLLRDASHINSIFSSMDTIVPPTPKQRSVQECLAIYRHESVAKSLSDEEIITLVQHKHIPAYQLEKAVGDMERGVAIR